MTTNPCCALPEELRNESGGPFGFVAIGRPGQDEDCCRHGVTVEQFLSKPENFGGTWLIDGGWGSLPGPVRVDWLNSQSRWQCRGYSAECRDPFLLSPSTTASQATMNQVWITDRLPTAADADQDGEVCIVTGPGRNGDDDWAFVHWSYVGQRAPWKHTGDWQPPTQLASSESERIAALEQRVAEEVRAQSVLTTALVKRLEALEGMAPNGVAPDKVPGGIAALEQRVAELEAFKRILMQSSPIRKSLGF